jgi:hypothetical protein
MWECGYDTLLPAGTWYLWKTGKAKVFLACPSCAGIVLIEIDDVNDDGTLVRAFKCRRRGCGFEDEVKLNGWPVT